MAFDINIFSGLEVPDRAMTLDLNTTLGTGDFTKGVDAYYIGTDISKLPVGWQTYEFPVNASSLTIPSGWVVIKGNGQPGTDADWQALMQDVETIGVELGEPGFFYPFGSGTSASTMPELPGYSVSSESSLIGFRASLPIPIPDPDYISERSVSITRGECARGTRWLRTDCMQTIWNALYSALGLASDPKDLTLLQVSLRGLIVFVVTLIIIRLGDRRSLAQKSAFVPGLHCHY